MPEEFSDVERQYSPSQWSPRFPTAEQVLQHHVDTVTAASKEAVNIISHKLDIEYGSTPRQKLDLFGTDLPNDAPIFVYIHGGYWQELSREISRYPVQPLYKVGIKTIIVGYDLCPSVTIQEIVNQIRNAAKYVFEYAEKMNSRGVYFAGHSAGAHLVSKILDNVELFHYTPGSNRLLGVFLISGIYDLRNLIQTTVNKPLELDEKSAQVLSPILSNYRHLKNSTKTEVKVHVIVGKYDSPAFQIQSKDFCEMLRSKFGVKAFLHVKDYDHFDIVEVLAHDVNYLMEMILKDSI